MNALFNKRLSLKAWPGILATLLFLGANNVMAADEDANNQRLNQMNGQIQSINEELSNQRANLGSLKAELAAQHEDSVEYRRSLLNELKALRRQNQSLVDVVYENRMMLNKNNAEAEIKPLRNYDLQTPDGKMYFGEDEYVYVKEADATFDARIDTGAAVSSISAKNITEFERNGKKWYRFTIEANEQEMVVEAPFVRKSTIRQVSKEDTTERLVVSLNVKIGDFSTKSEFTLSDRTKLQYPLLIGRTLLQDIAVVDVSRDHIQERNKDTFLILSRSDFEANKAAGKDPNADLKRKRLNAEAVGQIARPSDSYGSNLGPNSENALPAVRNKPSDEKAAAQDAKAKASPASKAGNIKENKEHQVIKEESEKKAAAKNDKAEKPKAKAESKEKAPAKSETK